MLGQFNKSILFAVALVASPFFAHADENQHVAPITEYVKAKVIPWLNNPEVVNAIKEQNAKTASLSESDIIAQDKKWRAEVDAAAKPMIDGILKNKLSAFLQGKKEEAQGMITEMFVMDAKGLNVGQSDVTSDYWQGDEDKWKKTFKVGANTIFVDKVEKDESTQTFQAQVSVTVTDETGKAIGAITLGINVDML